MKTKLYIKSENFINWYFHTGDDQGQEQEALDLGLNVIERLLEGSVTIAPQDILDKCEQTVIPLDIIEGFEDDNTFDGIEDAINNGRISENFQIKLLYKDSLPF